MFCSLLTRCTIPFARHTKRHLNVQRCSVPVSFFALLTWIDLDMCFAPQLRALFRHHNFQKCSERDVFCTFWLRDLLRATTACNFSSLMCRWLRTRRFSEPTFQSSGATNHWKNTVFRDFATFSRTCIFFLLTFSLLWSSLFCSSLLWLSSHLFFSICPYCRKFGFLNFLRLYIYIHIANPKKMPKRLF